MTELLRPAAEWVLRATLLVALAGWENCGKLANGVPWEILLLRRGKQFPAPLMACLQPLSERELANLQIGKAFNVGSRQAVLFGDQNQQQFVLHAGELFQQSCQFALPVQRRDDVCGRCANHGNVLSDFGFRASYFSQLCLPSMKRSNIGPANCSCVASESFSASIWSSCP